MQAVNNSDYSIAQFRFLARLILVHGRWAYIRLSRLILYFFYKNVTFALGFFWYGWFSGFSGQTIVDSWAIALFNTCFTFLPIFFFSLFDRDVSYRKIKEYPELYETGLKKHEFSAFIFWCWISWGILHSIILFFLTFFLFKDVMHISGRDTGLFYAGTTFYTAVIITVNLLLCIELNSWTILHVLAVALSIFLWFLFMIVYQLIKSADNNEMYYISWILFRMPGYWLTILLVTCVCLWPFLSYKIFRRNYFPMNVHIVQEEAKEGQRRDLEEWDYEKNDYEKF